MGLSMYLSRLKRAPLNEVRAQRVGKSFVYVLWYRATPVSCGYGSCSDIDAFVVRRKRFYPHLDDYSISVIRSSASKRDTALRLVEKEIDFNRAHITEYPAGSIFAHTDFGKLVNFEDIEIDSVTQRPNYGTLRARTLGASGIYILMEVTMAVHHGVSVPQIRVYVGYSEDNLYGRMLAHLGQYGYKKPGEAMFNPLSSCYAVVVCHNPPVGYVELLENAVIRWVRETFLQGEFPSIEILNRNKRAKPTTYVPAGYQLDMFYPDRIPPKRMEIRVRNGWQQQRQFLGKQPYAGSPIDEVSKHSVPRPMNPWHEEYWFQKYYAEMNRRTYQNRK